jgi:hypothetical protein
MTEELDTKTAEQLEAEWKSYCMSMCRQERNKLLAETDYVYMPDVTISDADLQIMNIYRQQLRDYPATFSAEFDAMTDTQKHGVTPQSFNFPVKPTEAE